MNIRIGIVGYGNLARGVEASVQLQPDMEPRRRILSSSRY